jgi:hypothetical protein
MISRCKYEAVEGWKDYGGRGISVCRRWSGPGGFTRFLADMGPRPSGTSIDRINNDGNYEPGNCRWATNQEQARHTKRSRFVTYAGETLTIKEWSERTGIKWHTLHSRFDAGWTPERALASPSRRDENGEGGDLNFVARSRGARPE